MPAYPPVNLDHVRALTDATGIIQHAIYSIPNRKTGYTTDDNSRALGVAVQCSHVADTGEARSLVTSYLSFLHYAQRPDGRFRNFLTYDQNFVDEESSEDCFGRSVLASAQVLDSRLHPNIRRTARHLLERARPHLPTVAALRARASLLVALRHIDRALPDEGWPAPTARPIAAALVEAYRAGAQPQWPWFEPFLTYCNGLMPWGLFAAHELMGDPDSLAVAEESLGFLHEVLLSGDYLDLVGCHGWSYRGGERARFDQQPVDADSFVQACLAAWRVTGKAQYRDWALLGLDWFFGRNLHGQEVYDPSTGGCFDGLTPQGVNQNQGAESSVVFLSAYLAAIEAGLVTPGTEAPALAPPANPG